MSTPHLVYICPFCFRVCASCEECHQHQMICCDVGALGDERRKPLMDASGRVRTRAPRWYLEAVGWVSPTDTPGTTPRAG